MSIARIFAAATTVLLIASPGYAQDQRPSFSCSAASSAAERTICRSRGLSALDRRMDRLYQRATEEARSNRDRRRLRRDQKVWLQDRDACDRSRPCLRRNYEARIAILESISEGDQDVAESDTRPSFSCRYVRLAAERRICRSERLAGLDRQMDALYTEVKGDVSGWRARRSLVASQRDWLVQRNECERDRRCIRRAYEARIAQLEKAKRALVPQYQRTSLWRSRCRRPETAAMKTTCASPQLWNAQVDMFRVLARALVEGNPDVILADQRSWSDSFNRCRSNARCQRRAYDERTAQLSNARYLQRSRRTQRGDDRGRQRWQSSNAWDETCDRPESAALETVCSRRGLWVLRAEMIKEYNRVNADINRPRDRRRLSNEQRDWARDFTRCKTDRSCIRIHLNQRVAALRNYRRGKRRPVDTGIYDDRPAPGGAWKRSALYNALCRRITNDAHRTVCRGGKLWDLRLDLSETYNAVERRARRKVERRWLSDEQVKWQRSFERCRSDRRCLVRAMSDRIAELRAIKW